MSAFTLCTSSLVSKDTRLLFLFVRILFWIFSLLIPAYSSTIIIMSLQFSASFFIICDKYVSLLCANINLNRMHDPFFWCLHHIYCIFLPLLVTFFPFSVLFILLLFHAIRILSSFLSVLLLISDFLGLPS